MSMERRVLVILALAVFFSIAIRVVLWIPH